MAANTDPRLQNQVIYSIYVRNHTSEGTFRAVIPDLDRIRALGTDIIWLMPIHPIGVEGKEGHAGRLTPTATTAPSTPPTAQWRTLKRWCARSTHAA